VAPRFQRYERVLHVPLKEYGHITMPGPTPGTVVVAFRDGSALPVERANLRRLRWWERLLNL
jgi:hypothetical protein